MVQALPLFSTVTADPILDFRPLGGEIRVLFVYPNPHMRMPHLGLAILSSCAQRVGAQVELCDLTGVPDDLVSGVLRTRLQRDPPDLVAFTATSVEWPRVLAMTEECRRLGVRHVVGGSHATADPDSVIEHADALVLGEGEGAFLDIMRAVANGDDLAGIPNTWVREAHGRIERCDRRPLLEDLDRLPFPDWSLFNRMHYSMLFRPWTDPHARAERQLRITIEGSRGCPYKCSYCCNSGFMKAYEGLGRWRREKSVDRLIAELVTCRMALGGMDRVVWVDEIFMTAPKRVRELAEAYRRAVGVPFNIQERPENVTPEKTRLLAEAGLSEIALGLESGDDNIRREVLNRRTREDVVERAFHVAKDHGVSTLAFTMVGMPGEDEAALLRTWNLLRRVVPDAARVSVLRPMKGTVLYEECVRRGLHDPVNDTRSYDDAPVLRHDVLDTPTIMRYQRLLTDLAGERAWWAPLVFHLVRKGDGLTDLLLGMRNLTRSGSAQEPSSAWSSLWRRIKRARGSVDPQPGPGLGSPEDQRVGAKLEMAC
jgi:radical SAM superfamily enzyme YgiQ (UPF0313 family)